jgi:hypothetical protein
MRCQNVCFTLQSTNHHRPLGRTVRLFALVAGFGGSLFSQPSPISVSPSSGNGQVVRFTATYSNSTGYTNIGDALFLVQDASGGPYCYAEYNVQANRFYLNDDAHSYWQGPVVPGTGSGAFVQNTDCVLTGDSTAGGNGNTLSVNFALAFKTAAFAGPKNVSLFAFNTSGAGSGWIPEGVWNVTQYADPPGGLSVQPWTGGMGPSSTFPFSVRSFDGYTYLSQVLMLFNTVIDGVNACYIMYDRSTNRLYLTIDDVTQWTGGLAPGTPGATISNSQCTIDVGQTTVANLWDTLFITPKISFNNTATNHLNGAQNVYAYASDLAGHISGWQQVGTWTVASSPLTISTPPTLPSAMATVPYSPLTFTATGGTPPYTWAVTSGLPAGMSFNPDTLYGTPVSLPPTNPTTLHVQVTDARHQVFGGDFKLAINAPSAAPVTTSSPTVTVSPGASVNDTVVVNTSAGFSGTVNFSASNLPFGVTASFSPVTVTGSGSTTVTIAATASAAAATTAVTVTAQDQSKAYPIIVLVTVTPLSAANVISPTAGKTLVGTTATFTWDSGAGASQYRLSVGSTPGASDYFLANTGTTRSALVNLPAASSPRTVYATLESFISGSWQSRSYSYTAGLITPTTRPSAVASVGALPNSPPNPGGYYVYNDGKPMTWSFQITGGIASLIEEGSLTVTGSLSARIKNMPSVSNPGDDRTFDVEFTAPPNQAPGPINMCVIYDYPGDGTSSGTPSAGIPNPTNPNPAPVLLCLADALDVYDATPHISGLTQYPPAADGSFYVALYGTNFGPSPGSVAVCSSGANPCNSTSNVSVVYSAGPTGPCPYCTWNDSQVNLLLIPSLAASGAYDLQLTSGGENHGLGFQSKPGQTGAAKSNTVTVTLTPLTSVSQVAKFNGQIVDPLNLSTGDTSGRQITTSVVPNNASFNVVYNTQLLSNPNSTCTASLTIPTGNAVGFINSPVTAGAAGCSGIFQTKATANGRDSSNSSGVVVPPQALIQQLHKEAHGYTDVPSLDPQQVVQRSVGMTDLNRFAYSSTFALFHGVSTFQDLIAQRNPTQVASDGTTDGPVILIDNAAAVFSKQIADPTGGSCCYWSPFDWETEIVMAKLQTQTTTFPVGLLDPQCFCYPDCSNSQIVVKSSMPLNTGQDKTNSPAFMFVRQRTSTQPAVVQIP